MRSGVERDGGDGLDAVDRTRFEQLVLPHLDAAFNLSRWLMRDRAEAEDATQEAMLRALRFFRSYHGGDARAWLLQIVRNTCLTRLGKSNPAGTTEFDEDSTLRSRRRRKPWPSPGTTGIASCAHRSSAREVPRGPGSSVSSRDVRTRRSPPLPRFPWGTVMSALARAREKLQRLLVPSPGPGRSAVEAGRELRPRPRPSSTPTWTASWTPLVQRNSSATCSPAPSAPPPWKAASALRASLQRSALRERAPDSLRRRMAAASSFPLPRLLPAPPRRPRRTPGVGWRWRRPSCSSSRRMAPDRGPGRLTPCVRTGLVDRGRAPPFAPAGPPRGRRLQ
jgi:RNA polymerase sigma-70 factor (ECF subfamily)